MATITVFGASAPRKGDRAYADGVDLGRRLAERGHAVVTGGYGGIMEAVSEGAAGAGGRVIGVTVPAVFPGRDGANSHVTEEVRAGSLMERIHQLTDIADASIAMPGSIGTLTELMAAWNIAFVARFADHAPKPVIAIGEPWRHIVELVTRELATDGTLVRCVPNVDEAVAAVDELLG